jgi:hypothetical protein
VDTRYPPLSLGLLRWGLVHALAHVMAQAFSSGSLRARLVSAYEGTRFPRCRDAGSLCLDTWSRAEPGPVDAAEAIELGSREKGQKCFSGAWPGACEWELRAESTDARTAHTLRQPINFMLSHATCAQATKQRAFACAGPSSVEPGSVMRAWLAWEDNQSDPK